MRIPRFLVAPRYLRQTAFVVLLAALPARLLAQTGTFLDRAAPSDLRVVGYNIHLDDIFPDDNPTLAAKFARVMLALQPDIINLQEIYDHDVTQTANLINAILPLGTGATWHAHRSFDNVIVSKYPFLRTDSYTNPLPPSTSYAMALVDLPDEQFGRDFYFMDVHFKCCSTFGYEESRRQEQADALVNWMRDGRTAGQHIDLPAGTPMAVVGDLNVVETLIPLETLLTGNIVNESIYGQDSPPDWDGSSLADAHPVHNGSGTTDWTYRSSGFSPSRLDYVLYTDSVADVSKSFVLNTVSMSPAERAATGLLQYDVTLTTSNYDHLPLVVDFRFPAEAVPGDFNFDRLVDTGDYERWREIFGSSSVLDADANGDRIVDAADYVLWRKYYSGLGSATAGAAVPEPASFLLSLITVALAMLAPWGQLRRMPAARMSKGAGYGQADDN